MQLRHLSICCLLGAICLLPLRAQAQQKMSMYGPEAMVQVNVNYVYSLEEALKQAKAQRRPIFFHSFADWAVPCHAMNKHVFANDQFADYLNRNFVNLFIDVTEREHRPLAERYHISGFAHYLVLDAQGEILMRLAGGAPLPEFQRQVARALSPKTSLKGTSEAYNKGKRSKQLLSDYLVALRLAGDRDTYATVAAEYLRKLKPKEYAKAENWQVFSSQIKQPAGKDYDFLLAHKAEFVKNNGARRVNNFIEDLFIEPLMAMATGSEDYDAQRLTNLFLDMQKADLPDSCYAYRFYEMAQFRGRHQYAELINYLRTNEKQLEEVLITMALSLNLPDMTEAERQLVVDYVNDLAATSPEGTATYLRGFVKGLSQTDGIKFEAGTLQHALDKAKEAGKLVFLDAYTSWCGPCKMMSANVFPMDEVGRVFNPRFVSLKMDMEKGEGPKVAKRYGIEVYPTMLILDAEGNEIKRIVGARQPQQLIDEVNAIAQP